MSHSHSVDYKTAFTVEELPDSQVKISGELPYAELEAIDAELEAGVSSN